MEMDGIGPNLVRKVSYLARLGLSEDEVERLARHFQRVLEYVRMLEELPNIDDNFVSGFVISTSLRDDLIEKSLERNDVIRNAPETDGIYIVIPRVIKKEE